MPEDRLIVSNIHRGGCRLTWKESKDNGGLPIEYIVEKYVVAGDVWTNYAQLSGTSIEVNDLETGREYAFAVKAVNAEGESDALPTAKTMVAKDAFSKSKNDFILVRASNLIISSLIENLENIKIQG